jgi:hypothetical protein
MLRRIVSHVSLFAVLLHLHWGCCVHLAACEQAQVAADCCHKHEHAPADKPVIPSHDDCHESHAEAMISAPLAVTSPDGMAAFVADFCPSSAQLAHTEPVTFCVHADEPAPLPLRAGVRSPALLN